MRKTFVFLLCLSLALLTGYAGYRSYKVWKQNHLLAMARQFISDSDPRNAMLCLRLALESNPQNLEAERLAAQACESEQSPAALVWRKRVVEQNPASTEDRLALAQTATLLHEFAVATNALAGVVPAGKNTAAYHNTAGTVYAAVNRFEEAKVEFIEAIHLDSRNLHLQFNLAAVETRGTDAQEAARGRTALENLSTNANDPELRCQALRELVMNARLMKHNEAALRYSSQLANQPLASFSDRLVYLDTLDEAHGTLLSQVMLSLEKSASTNTHNIVALAGWQQSHGRIVEGRDWLQSLPGSIRTNSPVAQLIAQCYLESGDWTGLEHTLKLEDWGESEFARHAFLARAFRGQNFLATSKSEWEAAISSASGRKAGQMMLLSMAAGWGWQTESEELLWTVVKQYPDETWASKALAKALYDAGRTRSLLTLFKQEMQSHPTDLTLKNNLAMTALLLNENDLNPSEMAREVYEKAPTNSFFATTYAYSLIIQKKNVQALAVLEKLKSSDLEKPSTCGYYGLALQANGNHLKAKKYLNLAVKNTHLPEEQKVFEAARTGA